MTAPKFSPPQATKKPYAHEHNNIKREDPYHWMRDPNWQSGEATSDPEIIAHLKAENEYTEQFLKPLQNLKQTIAAEIKARIKFDDESVPVKDGDYYYFNRLDSGDNYLKHFRRVGADGKAELLLDENQLAANHDYMIIGDISISDDHKLLAYSVDYEGNEACQIIVFDIASGKQLDNAVNNAAGDITWNLTNDGFFYRLLDEHHRPNKIFFHRLGTNTSDDVLIYHEPNPQYYLGVGRSSDRSHLIIRSGNSESNEAKIVDLTKNYQDLQLVLPRTEKVLYNIDIAGDTIFLCTNDKGPNFRMLKTPLAEFSPNADEWEEFIAHRDDEYLTGFDLQQDFICFTKRIDGLNQLFVAPLSNLQAVQQIPFNDASYSAGCYFPTYELPLLRVNYSSFSTPGTVYEYNPITAELIHRKTDEIPSGHNPAHYTVERIHAVSDDGTQVPISLFYNNTVVNLDEATAPVLLYGYGSYGIGMPARFSKRALSLVDRGAIYAVAHIRGGDDLGYEWYNQTRFTGKKKTFDDFIASAKHLIAESYTEEGNIVIMGGSAGGMLMGVAANEAPELYKGIVAMVPFVDVLSTMLDDTLPLTPGEYTEWGNPSANQEIYDYMASYSPYDNVKAQAYPHMLITAGLTDPRVSYWEGAKWAAKLRELNTADTDIMLKMEMGAGHFGPTGIDKELEDIGEIYAIICNWLELG